MGDEAILVGGGGTDYAEQRRLLLRYANRHGLATGATGCYGKTVTVQVLAEGLSAAGVPVVVQDVKGDISGLSRPGDPAGKAHQALSNRAAQIGMTEFAYRGYPVVFWDLFGQSGHPVRSTVSEMGPLLLARMMELTEAQEGVLNIAFRVADEQGLALLDLKDLQAMLVWLGDNAKEVGRTYGNIASASLGAIQRSLLVLENSGAAAFLGEPALECDLIATDAKGMGRINVLMSDRLMQSPRLYATFLHVAARRSCSRRLPEVGDADQPVLVFFFDEAHLLFADAPKALVAQVVTQAVRLVRSKGVGVWFFVTQLPDDVPGRRAGAARQPGAARAARLHPARRQGAAPGRRDLPGQSRLRHRDGDPRVRHGRGGRVAARGQGRAGHGQPHADTPAGVPARPDHRRRTPGGDRSVTARRQVRNGHGPRIGTRDAFRPRRQGCAGGSHGRGDAPAGV